jgi:hypothetical protein
MDSGLEVRSNPPRQAKEAVSQLAAGGSKTPTPWVFGIGGGGCSGDV